MVFQNNEEGRKKRKGGRRPRRRLDGSDHVEVLLFGFRGSIGKERDLVPADINLSDSHSMISFSKF